MGRARIYVRKGRYLSLPSNHSFLVECFETCIVPVMRAPTGTPYFGPFRSYGAGAIIGLTANIAGTGASPSMQATLQLPLVSASYTFPSGRAGGVGVEMEVHFVCECILFTFVYFFRRWNN